MSDHDDFAFEPLPGLPAPPPPGEELLWQGRPLTWALASESMGLTWIAGYFVVLALWRSVAAGADLPALQAASIALPYLACGVVVCGIVLAIARVQARATVYTITSQRVAMRIGAALTVTLNLPFTQIGSAAVDLRRSGSGTIALTTLGDTRLSYLVCWPHVRPWRANPTQPALRCIPEAARVADLLSEAAETRMNQPVVAPLMASAMAAE